MEDKEQAVEVKSRRIITGQSCLLVIISSHSQQRQELGNKSKMDGGGKVEEEGERYGED